MKHTIVLLILISFIHLFSSCDKDSLPQPDASKLSVALQQTYLANNQIDSAFATWEVPGQQKKIQFNLTGDQLITNIREWTSGPGTLTVHIYGKKNYQGNYSGEWEFQQEMTIKENNAVQLNGPASFSDPKWKPRIILKDNIGHEAIVALRPGDPYFFVKNIGHETLELSVDRGYWQTVGGIHMAGRKVWNCYSNCTGEANEEYFNTLPAQIGTKPWNHISITIRYQTNDDGSGFLLGFEHDI